MPPCNICIVKNPSSTQSVGPQASSPQGIPYRSRSFLRIDLKGDERTDSTVIGYRAKKNSHVIDLSKVGYYAATDFGTALPASAGQSAPRTGRFYILASKERIRVPPDYAAEMVAYEEAACGELRTHYAGFFDPGFGYGADGELKGTQVVLEVRPHDVPFLIHDGQTFFKVVYDRMLDVPDGSTASVSALPINNKP